MRKSTIAFILIAIALLSFYAANTGTGMLTVLFYAATAIAGALVACVGIRLGVYIATLLIASARG